MTNGILVDVSDGIDPDDLDGYTMRQMNAWCARNLRKLVFNSSAVVNCAVPRSNAAARGPGIYFLVRESRLTYIGQSNNVPTRLYQHEFQERKFDSVSIMIGVPSWIRDCIEYAYIKAWRPPENGKLIPAFGCPASDGFDALIAATDSSKVARFDLPIVAASG